MSKAYHKGYIHPDLWKYASFSKLCFTSVFENTQCYINKTLKRLRDLKCLPYLDKILVCGKTFDEQLENLEKVLMKLISKELKLNVSKSNLYNQKVRYYRQIISKDRYQADPVDNFVFENFWKPPKAVGEIFLVLGFIGFFWGYVKNYSIISKSIYDLLKDENNSSEIKALKKKATTTIHYRSVAKNKDAEYLSSHPTKEMEP